MDGQTYRVNAIDTSEFNGVDIALFAGTEGEKGASTLYASKFIEKGAVVIDNGNDFRLKRGVPLVVPEINKEKIATHKGLIANPNCTTIQAVVALGEIYKNFGLEHFILVSFQATLGAGKKAAVSLWEETKEVVNRNRKGDYDNLDKKITGNPNVFSHQIAFSVIPQIGSFQEENFTSEEWKVVKETHKILDDDSIKISATCVRVPVFTSHSEAIYFTTKTDTSVAEIEKVLDGARGVEYLRDSLCSPIEAEGKDAVFVSRLRAVPYSQNSFLALVCF